jgi:hypothetical protein
MVQGQIRQRKPKREYRVFWPQDDGDNT